MPLAAWLWLVSAALPAAQRPAPAVLAPAHLEPTPLALGEVRLRAESYEQTSPGHVEARGLVDLRVADVRVQADKADVIEEKQPDGGTRRRIVAEGNVVFLRGAERLSGDRLEMDDAGRGKLRNAVGYLEPGVFVEAREIERLDGDSYRVEGGTFTSCSQPNPRWGFSASRATVDLDDKITGTNAVFKVKGVPMLYTPFVYYPLGKEHRSTGFLLPSVGQRSDRGYFVTAGFFWAMGRSADQTFRLDYYEKGYGLGHELRLVGEAPSRWTLRSLYYDAKGPGAGDYLLDWSGLQRLPGGVRGAANLRLASNADFARDSQTDAARGVRTHDWSLSLERDLGFAVLSAYGQATDGGRDGSLDGGVPGLRLRRLSRPVWGGLVFGGQASAERLVRGEAGRSDSWTRYELSPTLSRPLRLSFLEVAPSIGYRYTRYGASIPVDDQGQSVRDEDGEVVRDGPPLESSLLEAALDVRGPAFARVFDTPGLGYSPRFKHTIGPELRWTFRRPLAEASALPPSGLRSELQAADRIDYALVQRFYAKRPGSGGKAMTYELLSWRLAQTYDFRAAVGTAPLGPLTSRWTLRPTPDRQLDCELAYDPASKRIQRSSVGVSTRWPGFLLEASWVRLSSPTQDSAGGLGGGETPLARSETLEGRSVWEPFPRRLTLEGKLDYDLAERRLWQIRGRLRYSTQCCGFAVEHNWRRRDTGPADAEWRLAIELANVGSIGLPF